MYILFPPLSKRNIHHVCSFIQQCIHDMSESKCGYIIIYMKCTYYTSSGVTALVWLALWWYYVYDNPEDDPRITDQELKFLQESLGGINTRNVSNLHNMHTYAVTCLKCIHFE